MRTEIRVNDFGWYKIVATIGDQVYDSGFTPYGSPALLQVPDGESPSGSRYLVAFSPYFENDIVKCSTVYELTEVK